MGPVRFLLDTHVFIWASAAPGRLSETARMVLLDPGNELFVSAASIFEMALKERSRGLASMSSSGVVRQFAARLGLAFLPVSAQHALAVYELPIRHRDPFDLLLIAQSQVEGMTLVSADRQFAHYDVDLLW